MVRTARSKDRAASNVTPHDNFSAHFFDLVIDIWPAYDKMPWRANALRCGELQVSVISAILEGGIARDGSFFNK